MTCYDDDDDDDVDDANDCDDDASNLSGDVVVDNNVADLVQQLTERMKRRRRCKHVLDASFPQPLIHFLHTPTILISWF